MKIHYLFLLSILFISCKNDKIESSEAAEIEKDSINKVLTFSENIEKAHHKAAYMQKDVVSFDINLTFNGNSRLNARIFQTPNSSKIKVVKNDSTQIIFDGSNMYAIPEGIDENSARFDAFTWSYFFSIPFKLTDPGTVWAEETQMKLDSMEYPVSKLTFESGTGDSPDDWYMVYQDPETKMLKAAAYIVTFSSAKDEAEKNPHAIVYSDYQNINNIPFAHTWSFHNWNFENGLEDKIGEAKISNIKFSEMKEEYFNIPENAKKID
ncbi:DUF6503 family protein [Gramella sp. AN32]|uniref:DUF6503 family protein n=1 Tax=Christiangramia antarctica TaxID=2058158 RepID=A0ABW5X7X7_9FLAO|nr:DUF6503 family protein [Gramella sp. AN32]MCM4154613.1 hypothetical protein [Gramella sp. AN32]